MHLLLQRRDELKVLRDTPQYTIHLTKTGYETKSFILEHYDTFDFGFDSVCIFALILLENIQLRANVTTKLRNPGLLMK